MPGSTHFTARPAIRSPSNTPFSNFPRRPPAEDRRGELYTALRCSKVGRDLLRSWQFNRSKRRPGPDRRTGERVIPSGRMVGVAPVLPPEKGPEICPGDPLSDGRIEGRIPRRFRSTVLGAVDHRRSVPHSAAHPRRGDGPASHGPGFWRPGADYERFNCNNFNVCY